MIPGPLEILIVAGEEPITAALERALGRRGHRAETARNVEKALAMPVPDVFVCEAVLPGACGFDLLAAMRERGDRARAVLLFDRLTVEDCLRALDLGAGALLTRPFRLADLIRAVEDDQRPTLGRTQEERGAFESSYPDSSRSVERCARDLAAFALRLGMPPSARARMCGAAAEIVDNAHRHARLRPRDRIRVQAELAGRSMFVRIRDEGVGFDPASTRARLARGPARTGLARASALSEAMRVETASGAGTLVELKFCATLAGFSDAQIDLSESDFLAPGTARSVLSALLDGETPDVEGISPCLAVVLGRLLAGPDLPSFRATPTASSL